MARNRSKKVIKYRKPLQMNIGVVVFFIILMYLIYNVFSYLTSKQISPYEVEQGTIAQNTVFTGMILREETVYYAQDKGYINYYNKDASKVGVGEFIYSVDETGEYYNQLTTASSGMMPLSDDAYLQLGETADSFLTNYSDNAFYQVYQFKLDIEAALRESASLQALQQLGDYTQENAANSSFHSYRADKDGVLVYNTDGLEGTTEDSLTPGMFDPSSYQKNNFVSRTDVSSGDPVYKMITSEIWQVAIPIEEKLAADLVEEKNIKVQFKKDNTTAWGASKIVAKDNTQILILTFQNSMIRFATDRYLELELLLSDTSGLKIPITAITKKDFPTVPKEYITKGGDSDSDGVLKEVIGKDGNKVTEFVRTTLFHETDTDYYLEGEGLALGDTLIMPDSNERFTIKKKETLQGVYNINKGYAVFKQIEILFQNEEYAIVKSKTSYGIALYDYIALDSSVVNENDIIH